MNRTASTRQISNFDQESCQRYVGKQIIRGEASVFKVNRVDTRKDRIVCQRLVFGRTIPVLAWQPRVVDFMALLEIGELKIKQTPAC